MFYISLYSKNQRKGTKTKRIKQREIINFFNNVVGEFEKFPSYEWIWNWDQTIKEKAAKKENPQPKKRFNPAAMTTEELLAKLEEKNRRRAEHNLPPLTLMEYLESKGVKISK